MSRQIRRQAKIDRHNWLNDMLENGSWQALKKYQKQLEKSTRSIQLRDKHGAILAMKDQAESMSEFFETMQWYVRPACIIEQRPAIFQQLDISNRRITSEELRKIICVQKNNKACGLDNIPTEL